jgi:DNA modification methylase
VRVTDAVTLHHGDCRAVLATFADASIDAIVTDPPYELSFMGKAWDGSGIAYDPTLWAECLRVLKPGGHLLAFGGTRTYHRMAVAIEDAGFEIRDSIHWVYGSGFPKSLDVSKAIDKVNGGEREIVGAVIRTGSSGAGKTVHQEGGDKSGVCQITAPATDAARQWAGWGTALKPAHEPIIVARKPLAGTVAATVLAHGTGAINVDGCRVGTEETWAGNADNAHSDYSGEVFGKFAKQYAKPSHTLGRWPANFVLTHAADCADTCADGCPVRMLDGQSGVTSSTDRPRHNTAAAHNSTTSMGKSTGDWTTAGHTDTGGASRFFPVTHWDAAPFLYVAKPSRSERNAGLDGLPESQAQKWNSGGIAARRAETAQPVANVHPTVKPVDLMRWLVRLVTPPGGVVLDPFAGSGTTLVAASLEGVTAIGIEMTDEYLPIIVGRVRHARPTTPTPPVSPTGDTQLTLFGEAS